MEWDTYQRAIQSADKTYIINSFADLDDQMDEIFSIYNDIEAIVSFSDFNNGVYLSAKYTEKYLKESKTFDIESVKTVSDKLLTRKHLDELDLNNIDYRLVRSIDEAQTFLKEHSSMVVKDRAGQGSKNVWIVQNETELIECFKSGSSEFLVEEQLFGREYSVEAVIRNGKYNLIGITEKELIGVNNQGDNPLVEKGHVFPARINQQLEEKINDYLSSFHKGLNIKNSVVHTEVMIRKEKITLIETHLRAGGDYIPKLVEFSCGVNLYELFFQALEGNVIQKIKKVDNGISQIQFFMAKKGKVKECHKNFNPEYQKFIKKDYLTISKGQEIVPILESFDRNCGCIIVTHKEKSAEIINNLLKSIEVIYE